MEARKTEIVSMCENIIFFNFQNCPTIKYAASWNNTFPDTKKYSKHKCIAICQGFCGWDSGIS